MLQNTKVPAVATLALLVAGCGGSSYGGSGPTLPPPTGDLSTGPATCNGGTADDFSCFGVDLRSRVPLTDMGGVAGNDLWGWADAQSGNEYALMGMTNGTAFVDVTDPENPVYLGILPTETISSPWRDIKVYQDHAYIVADASGAHGMQAFDLTRLRGVNAPQTFNADALYSDDTDERCIQSAQWSPIPIMDSPLAACHVFQD